eukprot:7181813-Lingulodinium_polyedra.AAC.1
MPSTARPAHSLRSSTRSKGRTPARMPHLAPPRIRPRTSRPTRASCDGPVAGGYCGRAPGTTASGRGTETD